MSSLSKDFRLFKQHNLRVILMGSTSAGKTSFLQKIKDNNIDIFSISNTIGSQYSPFQLFLSDYQAKINLKVWDTSGQEDFQSFFESYVQNADAVFFFINLGDIFQFYSNEEVYESKIKAQISTYLKFIQSKRKKTIIYHFILSKMDLLGSQKERQKIVSKSLILIQKIINKCVQQSSVADKIMISQCIQLYDCISSKQQSSQELLKILDKISQYIYLQQNLNSNLLKALNKLKLKPEFQKYGQIFKNQIKISQQKSDIKLIDSDKDKNKGKDGNNGSRPVSLKKYKTQQKKSWFRQYCTIM